MRALIRTPTLVQTRGGSHSALAWSGLLLLTLLAIYLPGLGHGFIKDDFVWIASNQVTSPAELVSLFTHAPDFYRPVVAVSFAVDWWLFGVEPFAYGLTNLCLLLATAAVLGSLGVALGMSRGSAVVVAALWSLNFHGINMSLLWISGRTSLLLTLFALLAARAFVSGWGLWAAVCGLLAMLSKEEAVLLPFVLLLWGVVTASGDAGPRGVWVSLRSALRRVWPLFVVLVLYLLVRTAAGGMTPMSAPAAYQFALDPAMVGRNVLEYLDRAVTLSAAAVVVMSLVARALPRPTSQQKRWLVLGAIWMVGGYGLAVLLPVRSSLYAVGPSAGGALAGAALLAAVWEQTSHRARRRMVMVAALIAALVVPIHWSRNDRWVELADLSTHVLDEVAPLAASPRPDGVVQIDDDRGTRANLDGAFGTLIETAVLVRTGSRLNVWIEPPPVAWQLAGLVPPEADDVTVRFALRNGALVRVAP